MAIDIKIISTYSGLLPLVAGIFCFNKKVIRLFAVFIGIGLVNDYLVYQTNNIPLANLLMSIYSLIDIVFLIWFTTLFFSISNRLKFLLLVGIITHWFICYKMYEPWNVNFSEQSTYFDPPWLASAAILAAIGLLKIIESPLRLEYNQYFGFYLGIFFYNFCVFFTHIFLSDDIAKEIWYLNALFNITTMLIYTWAFLRLLGPQRS